MVEVLHCDNHVLALVKPAGMPVVPDSSGDESLLDWAKAWVKIEHQKPGDVFLGVVHRLDRPVSGIVVFGRTSKGADRLSKAWRENRVQKIYHAVSDASARFKVGQSGILHHWLCKDREKNMVRVVCPTEEIPDHVCLSKDARLGKTQWRILAIEKSATRLELKPLTGRSHQLRVACASLQMPLRGDLKYGAEMPMAGRRIALHACELRLPHPTRHTELHFLSPEPF
jgi:23S rRNA pseudouridine1911/1915/1917 synthase